MSNRVVRFSYFGPECGGPSVCVEVEEEEEEAEEAAGGGGEVSIACADEEEESAGPCWVDPSLAWPWNKIIWTRLA